MSGYFDDPDERPDNSGSGLRKQLEEALTEIRELRAQVDKDSTAAKAETATDLLKSKGLDPELLQLVPEGSDPVEWVGSYAHLLGAKEPEQVETKIDEPAIVAAPDDDPAIVAERQALAKMRGAAESGSSSVVSNDLLEGLSKLTTEEEVLAYFRENGSMTG